MNSGYTEGVLYLCNADGTKYKIELKNIISASIDISNSGVRAVANPNSISPIFCESQEFELCIKGATALVVEVPTATSDNDWSKMILEGV